MIEVADVTGGRALNTAVLPMSDADAGEVCSDGRAPLFYLARVHDGWRPYTQVLYTPAELLFMFLGDEVLTGDPLDETTARAWFSQLSERHRRYSAQLNNHQRFFAVHRPDEEIEHKFTLAAELDIWSLATRLLAAVTAGNLPGWIGEYRNEFEQWDFFNHLYEIAEPAAERGYVSFIPAVDGSWIIKRKWFAQDQPIRREQRDRGVVLPADADLEGEITARFGITPAWGVSFRRVRFDINVESLRTGHGYSVMFDRCTTMTGPSAVLQQCEVEYLRSRTLRRIDDAELLAEFGLLCDWVRDWLHDQRVDVVEDHLSKLSFLRRTTNHAEASAGPGPSGEPITADSNPAERKLPGGQPC